MKGETSKKLGQILLDDHLILPEQLDAALQKQTQTGKRLGQVLIDMDLITYDSLVSVLSRQNGIPHIWLRKGLIDPKIVHLVPREKAEAYQVIPMFKVHNTLTLAMADSTDLFVVDDIERLTGLKVQPVQCRSQDLVQTAIKEYYSEDVEMDDFLESFQESDVEVVETGHEDLRMVEEMAEGARIINLVNLILSNGIKEGASDIHIEPDIATSHVRYRIDGALQEVMTPRRNLHPAIVSRVKVMARMDISERRIPQDGRIHINADGREADVRVSSMPTVVGEKIVMRLLDRSRLVVDINEIGIEGEQLLQMKSLLHRPNGILLVTGPTGSGKTTTLYASLAHLRSVETNIVTIEDPVEYQIERITQIQVNEEQGLSFAKTLRSVLRQDPDVIMIGEIRDRDTAEVAVQAALTGHLVLATLHTNESAGALVRLIEMGIEPYLLTSAITGVIAQRLVRLVCTHCKTVYFPPRELLNRIGWKGRNSSFVTGQGCEHCFDSGLRNRAGVFEIMVMDSSLRQLILQNPSADAIRHHNVQRGMLTLRDQAFRLVEDGKTSLDAVMRVLFLGETTEDIETVREAQNV